MIHKTTGAIFSIWNVYYYDMTNSRYVWTDYYATKYYLSELIGVPVTVDGGDRIYPSAYMYANPYSSPYVAQQWYKNPKTGYGYLFYETLLNRWVISKYLGYGVQETDNGVGAVPRWEGDAWYSLEGSSVNGTYVPRGSLKESPPADVVVDLGIIEGWECDTRIGLYEPVYGSAVTGNKWVGWRALADDGAGAYYKNYEDVELYNSKPTFTKMMPVLSGFDKLVIWYDGENWIISLAAGTKDENVGYWQSADMIGEYSLVYGGGGIPPEPATYTITHHGYSETVPIGGQRMTDMDIAQVAIWLGA